MAEEPLVIVTDQAGVRTLTLNRPKALNSFTGAMHGELAAALEAVVGRDRNLHIEVAVQRAGLAGVTGPAHPDPLTALDPGALERFLDRDPAQFMGRKGGERPVEGADRRAGGAHDDDVVFH